MIALLVFIYGFLFLGILYFARKRPEYSHARHSISELAETGSEYEKQVSYFVFLPFGLLAVGLASYSYTENLNAAVLLTAVGLSYLLSAIFPCDPGAPAVGSWKTLIHNIVGASCYAAMLYQLKELADTQSEWWATMGLTSLSLFLVSFFVGWPRNWTGLLQRLAEVCVFLNIAKLML